MLTKTLPAGGFVINPVNDIRKAIRDKRYCLALLFMAIHLESRLKVKLLENRNPHKKINRWSIKDMSLGRLIKHHSKCTKNRDKNHFNYAKLDKRNIRLLKEINACRNKKVAHKIDWWYETEKPNPSPEARMLISQIKRVTKRGLRLLAKLS